jgi:hypothetical protein
MKLLNPVLANVVWAALFLEGQLLTLPVVAAGLVIEYFFVRRLTGFNFKRALFADVAMNAASVLLGVILIPLAGLVWELAAGVLLYKLFELGSFSYVSWAATFVLAVLVNAAIENFVLRKFFKPEKTKAAFWWLCLANALSVGVAFAGLWFYPNRSA